MGRLDSPSQLSNLRASVATRQHLEKLRDQNLYQRLKEGAVVSEQSNLQLTRHERKIVELSGDLRVIERIHEEENQYLRYLKR